jgi:hypothetical protein
MCINQVNIHHVHNFQIWPIVQEMTLIVGYKTCDYICKDLGFFTSEQFRHLHEIQSGRTSSISHEILGFNGKGEVRRYSKKLYKNYSIFLYLLIIRIAVINVKYIYIFFKNSSIYIFNILILL